MVGDVVKISSWLLGYVFVAKAMVFWFVVTELLFSFLFCFLVYFLSESLGLVVSSIAYTIAYFAHFIFIAVILRVKAVI